MSRIRSLIASFLALFKREKPVPTPVPIRAAELQNERSVLANTAIDYTKYAQYDPFTLQTQVFPNGKPVGWSWVEYDKARGKDSQTTDAAGRKIEEQEARQYTSTALLDLSEGAREALLTTPGVLIVNSPRRFSLTIVHGSQSKGVLKVDGNGLNLGSGPNFNFAPGSYTFDISGGARVAVSARPE